MNQRHIEQLEALKAERTRGYSSSDMCKEGPTTNGPMCDSPAACIVTAHELLVDLESCTNQHWLDLQSLRRALPQELSPAANRALCRLIRPFLVSAV